MAREIEFVFRGDVSDLNAALKEAQGGLEDVGDASEDVGKKGKAGFELAGLKAADFRKAALGAAAGAAAITAAIAATVKATVDFAAQLNQTAKEARQFGTTAEEIQKLDGALALLTDGSVRAAEVARFLGRNLANAADDGAGPAADALDKLNLSAADLLNLPITEQVRLIGAQFGNLTSNGERTQVAMDLLGRAGTKLVAAFEQGPEAFEAALASIEGVGVVSNETAASAEMLTDAVELLSRQSSILKADVLSPLMPVLTGVADGTREWLAELRDSGEVDEFASVVRQAFVDIVIPAALAMGKIVGDSLIVMGPALQKVEANARAVGAAFLLLGGNVKQAREQWDKASEANKTASAALDEVDGRLEKNAERFSELTDKIATNIQRTERAAEVQRDFGRAVGDTNTALNEQGAAAEEAAKRAAKAAEEEAEARRAANEQMFDAQVRLHMEVLRQAEAERAAREQQMRDTVAVVNAAGSAISDISRLVADRAIEDAERRGASEREAALEAFRINKAVAIIQATINTALAIVNALATAPNIIAGIALAAIAGVTGAIQIALIASQQPPSFHTGGVVTGAMAAARAPDEVDARLLTGEGVLNRDTVRRMGGTEAVRQANRTGGASLGSGGTVTVLNRVGPSTTDAATHEALRRGRGTLAQKFREVQPQRVGRYRTYGKR